VQSRLRGALSVVGREALKIVLPSWCISCERQLPWRRRTASCCSSCWDSLARIESGKCRSCALPLPVSGATFLCLNCTNDPLPVDWCDAWGEYRGPLERLLRALKFKRHDFLGDALASLLEETLRARGDLAFDAIVGVPMPRARQRRRGYNQAELLARALARRIGVPCMPALLTKRGETPAQSKLARAERAANVRRAFAAAPRANGRAILLVDDVSTTGETIRACAGVLLRAGAARVCAAVVAKTEG
jgi:ComF family protein